MKTAELLRFEPQSPRGLRMFAELEHTAPRFGVVAKQTASYRGDADVLVLWGAGSPLRWPAMERQLEQRKHYVGLDLAYWNRESKIRVTVDAPHPQAWVMSHDWPDSRFYADPPRLANVWDPRGPVVVAGIGIKSKVQYGAGRVLGWEEDQIDLCLAAGRSVVYRQKNRIGESPVGIPMAKAGSIDEILHGASVVVTWSSNVAVDAIRLGIPAVCADGAAAAVCPSSCDHPDAFTPLKPEVRHKFLRNLAWFQWAPQESGDCWRFLQELLS